ncbi:MAG: hypothetical protein KC657_36090 [Myxococcales bacterium]|nr:hypothetical protein [Myxococcales bacterium]
MPSYVAVYLRRPGEGWPVDSGDDPSFEYATETTGPVTWGVCRPDVRNAVAIGDVVVFFAADSMRDRKPARYFWVGFATVHAKIAQDEVFEKESLAAFRSYPNLLIRPHAEGGYEHFEKAPHALWHDNWLWRMVETRRKPETFAEAHRSDRYDRMTTRADGSLISLAKNYIVFAKEDVEALTWIAARPPLVAEAAQNGAVETWSITPLATELRSLLFTGATRNTLRTTNSQTAHSPAVRLPREASIIRADLIAFAHRHGLAARSNGHGADSLGPPTGSGASS